MKRNHGIRLSLLAALCLATAARADIVTLKSGEKMEGRILSETPESIEMEYKLTPKIKDKKTVQKSEIKEIKRQTAAEVEFEEKGMRGLVPTPDLMTASEYESILQDKLRSFAVRYPGTPEAAEVEKMITTLADEKSKVVSGQVKMEGKWLDATTAKRETYNIAGYRQYMLMKSEAAKREDLHNLNALREFNKLRTDYAASPYFTLSIPVALDLLKSYETQLNAMLTDAPIYLKKRDEGLKTMNPQDAALAKKANDEQMREYRATVDQQFKNKVKWKDINKYDIKGLQDALLTVTKERAELTALDLTALAAENGTIMSIIRFLADGNATEAKAQYDKISHEQGLVNRAMLPGLKKQIEQRQKEISTATRTARATAVTDTQSPTAPAEGGDVNPLKAALEKAKADKEKAAAAKASGASASKQPGADGSAPAKSGDEKKPAPLAPAPAEEGGIMATLSENIPYIGGGLLVVILLIWFLGKKKNKD